MQYKLVRKDTDTKTTRQANEEYTLEVMLRTAYQNISFFIIALDGEEEAGYATLSANKLKELFVQPNFRKTNRKVATNIMKHAVEEIIKNGYETLKLNASFDAIAYYEKLGLKPTQEYKNHNYEDSIDMIGDAKTVLENCRKICAPKMPLPVEHRPTQLMRS